MNDVATHPLTLTRRSRSPRPTSMEKYLFVNKLKVSLVGSMVRNDEDWRTFQALGLCGALLLLRGRVKSGLLLLIAVALASKKNPEWDRKNNQKLKANKNKVRWMEQEPLANKTSKDSKKTQKKRMEQPQRRPPKRDKDQGHPIKRSGLGGVADVPGYLPTDRARPSSSNGVESSRPPQGALQEQSVHVIDDEQSAMQSVHETGGRQSLHEDI